MFNTVKQFILEMTPDIVKEKLGLTSPSCLNKRQICIDLLCEDIEFITGVEEEPHLWWSFIEFKEWLKRKGMWHENK